MHYRRVGLTIVWTLAVLTSLLALRYFLVPPPFLTLPGAEAFIEGPLAEAAIDVGPKIYANHRVLLLIHIGSAVIAMIVGLPQFLGGLRNVRPRAHRIVGSIYVGAVVVAGAAGFPLSFLILEGIAPELRPQIYPTVAGFASLAIVWPLVSLMAVQRARRRRWNEHRAWMIRSYSLTFAAVTVRLVGPVLLLLSSDPVVVVTGAIWSWPVNLVVAEWMIRRRTAPILAPSYVPSPNVP